MDFVVLILMGFAARQSASVCTDADCLASDYESMLQATVSVENGGGNILQSEDEGQFSSEAEKSGCSTKDLKEVLECAKTKPSCEKAFNCGNGQNKKKENYCEPRWFDLCRNNAIKKCTDELGKSKACYKDACDKYDECRKTWCCDCLESKICKKECKRAEKDSKKKYSEQCIKDLKKGDDFLEFESDASTQSASNASVQQNRIDSVEDSMAGKRTCR